MAAEQPGVAVMEGPRPSTENGNPSENRTSGPEAAKSLRTKLKEAIKSGITKPAGRTLKKLAIGAKELFGPKSKDLVDNSDGANTPESSPPVEAQDTLQTPPPENPVDNVDTKTDRIKGRLKAAGQKVRRMLMRPKRFLQARKARRQGADDTQSANGSSAEVPDSTAPQTPDKNAQAINQAYGETSPPPTAPKSDPEKKFIDWTTLTTKEADALYAQRDAIWTDTSLSIWEQNEKVHALLQAVIEKQNAAKLNANQDGTGSNPNSSPNSTEPAPPDSEQERTIEQKRADVIAKLTALGLNSKLASPDIQGALNNPDELGQLEKMIDITKTKVDDVIALAEDNLSPEAITKLSEREFSSIQKALQDAVSTVGPKSAKGKKLSLMIKILIALAVPVAGTILATGAIIKFAGTGISDQGK